MTPLQQMFDALTTWATALSIPDVLGQLLALVAAGVIGKMAQRRILTQLDSADGQVGVRRFVLRTIERTTLPLAAMLVIVVLRGLFAIVGIDVELLAAAIPLLFSLALVRVAVYAVRRAFAPTPLVKASENLISTMVWTVVVLHLLGWLPAVVGTLDSLAVNLGTLRISVLSVLKLLMMTVLMVTLALWLSKMIDRRVSSSEHFGPAMRIGLAKFSKFLLLGFALLIALDTVGIDLTALAVFGGALGVGLGFGLQRIASNFISGFILILDRSIKPGDVISIGTKFGWVEEMRARYIVVRNRDGEESLIPNENLITTEVVNWSYHDPNVRMKIPVSISYHDDPELALQLLGEAARATPRVLAVPEPAARLMQFGNHGIELEVRIWISDPQNGVANVKSDVNLAIWRLFKEHGITIPFPQLDLHLPRTAGGLSLPEAGATDGSMEGPVEGSMEGAVEPPSTPGT